MHADYPRLNTNSSRLNFALSFRPHVDDTRGFYTDVCALFDTFVCGFGHHDYLFVHFAVSQFLGFHQLSKAAVNMYRDVVKSSNKKVRNDLRDLSVWHRVEKQNPSIFQNMYRFWVTK